MNDQHNPLNEVLRALENQASSERSRKELEQQLADTMALVDKLRVNLNRTIIQVQELTRRLNKLEAGF